MKKIIIDTNTLISFVTDRNPEQQKIASALFDDAANLKIQICCPQNVLTEFVYVMDKIYEVSHDNINEILHDFISMSGIKIVNEHNIAQLLFYWPEYFADFGNAIVASVCKEISGALVATFDRKFIIELNKAGLEIYTLE